MVWWWMTFVAVAAGPTFLPALPLLLCRTANIVSCLWPLALRGRYDVSGLLQILTHGVIGWISFQCCWEDALLSAGVSRLRRGKNQKPEAGHEVGSDGS